MRRILFLITFASIVAGCGRQPVLQLGEFEPYVRDFEKASEAEGNPVKVDDLVVTYGEMSKTERGVCEYSTDTTPKILIHEKYWKLMTEDERQSLMFHELGHCVLKRHHNDDRTQDGVPASLMNAYMLDRGLYRANKNWYRHELFKPTEAAAQLGAQEAALVTEY